MWSEGYTLFISCILAGITFSEQQSIKCSNDCTLKVIYESSVNLTTINGQDCEDMIFHHTSNTLLSKFSMEAHPFQGNFWNYSKIDMTFSKIKWHCLKIRVKSRETRKSPFCQELKLTNGLEFPEEAQVQLDCQSFCKDNEELDIEYVTFRHDKMENKILAMKSPNWNNIKNDSTCTTWEVFMYIDITEIPKLRIYWNKAPTHLGINSYILKMINAQTKEEVKTVSVSDGQPGDVKSVEFNEPYSGKFYFTMQPECENKTWGYISKSAEVQIDLPFQANFFMIAGGTTVLISLLLLIWALTFCITPGESPVVLIVYKSTRTAHVEAVLAFARYLREVCHVRVKIDEVDVRLSGNMDPYVWYQETFSQANAVMVVSSPPQVSGDDMGTYYNLGEVGLKLLTEHFCDKKQKFFYVLLPYCTKEDIPQEAKNLRQFAIPRQLDDMLMYLHERRRISRYFCLCFVRRILIPNPKSYSDRRALSKVFEKAAEELKRPPPLNTVILPIITVEPPYPIPNEVQQTSDSDSSDEDNAYPGPIHVILHEHVMLQNEKEEQQELIEQTLGYDDDIADLVL